MEILNYTQCCGVKEIGRIGGKSHEKIITDIFKDSQGSTGTKYAFLTFTSNDGEDGYGAKFRDYIVANKLGTVVETIAKKNPNTGAMVKHFTWDVDLDVLEALSTRAIKVMKEEKKKEKEFLSQFKVGMKIRLKKGHRGVQEPFSGVAVIGRVPNRINDNFRFNLANGYIGWYFSACDMKQIEIVPEVKAQAKTQVKKLIKTKV